MNPLSPKFGSGRVNPDNFPLVNDYRNALLAEAMKILGMVNKYNRGITNANKELKRMGIPRLLTACALLKNWVAD